MAWLSPNDGFDRVPLCNDELFDRLWRNGGLQVHEHGNERDWVDEVNARLVNSAFTHRNNIFIGLPDFRRHRAPLLLATSILRFWYMRRSQQTPRPGLVAHIGTSVGIRKQLSHVSVPGLILSDVFPQVDLVRGGTYLRSQQPPACRSSLPEVTTIYSPADVKAILDQKQPDLVTVDCGSKAALPWIKPLVAIAQRRNLQVIAWGENPLADYINIFGTNGQVFLWTPFHFSQISNSVPPMESVCSEVAKDTAVSVRPIALAGQTAESVSKLLEEATRALINIAQSQPAGLAADAMRMQWWRLRAIENLHIPMDFHEAEASHLWGLNTLAHLKEQGGRFIEALCGVGDPIVANLETVDDSLSEATKLISPEGPMWQLLCNLILEEPEDGTARLLVFQSDASRKLFSHALLVRYGISDEDLEDLGSWIFSLKNLEDLIRCREADAEGGNLPFCIPPLDYVFQPVLVGMPSIKSIPRLLPLIRMGGLDVLIYPHQIPSIKPRLSDSAERLCLEQKLNKNTLKNLAPSHPLIQKQKTERLVVAVPSSINVVPRADPKGDTAYQTPMTEGEAEELTNLFNIPDVSDVEAEGGYPEIQVDGDTNGTIPMAYEVLSDEGWRILFNPSQEVHVARLTSGGKMLLSERNASNLRRGDRIVVIHGQRRQNLYDLIVERIHALPAIQLHLALIDRWHTDLRIAFSRWQHSLENKPAMIAGPRNVAQLLTDIQQNGSKLSCELTLRMWLNGSIRCPNDPEDIRRIAKVLGMKFVATNYQIIHRASGRLAGIHRSLSRRLNSWLQSVASGAVDDYDAAIVDKELGLTFGDFRSSLQIISVSQVNLVEGPFSNWQLGLPERIEEE